MSKNQIAKASTTTLAAKIGADNYRDFFRIITAKQNNLSEIFTSPCFVSLKDFAELNTMLIEKMKSYNRVNETFRGIVSFNNYRSRESSSWELFQNNNWTTSDLTESVTLKWEYVVLFPDREKPCPFSVTLRCASPLEPQQVFQTMMTKDIEDIDPAVFKSATMSCKVDFSDPLISQELLDVVARWNRARRRPEAILPGLGWCSGNSHKVSFAIRIITPLVTFLALIAYFYTHTKGLEPSASVTNGFLSFSVLWFCWTFVTFIISNIVFSRLASFVETHLDKLSAIHIFELTSGDENRQTALSAQSRRSLIKACVSSVFSIIWNVLAAWIAVKFFNIR